MNSTPINVENTTATNTANPGATLDISKMSIDQKAGVTLGEQQEVQQILPNEYNLTVMNKRANTHLNDNAWDLESMLTRHNYVTTVQWDTTSAPGTVLFSANVIEDLLKLDINSMPFQRYRYWRAKNVKLHFQITGNRFLAGRLLAYFYPSMTGDSVTISRTKATLLQNVLMDPSAATSLDLIIPFNFYKGYVDLNQGDCLGTVQLMVYNSLASAIGTTPTIDIKVYMSVEGSEFKVPIPGSVAFQRVLRVHKHSSLMQGIDQGFADLTKSIMPSAIVGDLLGGLLDKPEEPEQPTPIVRKDQEYLSNSRGAEYLEKLSLDPSAQQLVDEEHFSTNQDEMNIDYLLKKKKSLIRTVTWNQTDIVGTILWSEQVGPLLNLLKDANDGYNTRLIDFIAANFTYWKGGLKYLFDVVGTQLHEGRLDVMFLPGEIDPISDYTAATSVYIGSVVIRNGENSFAFVTPFLSDTPWRQVYYGGEMDVLAPKQRFDDYASGTIQLVVANQLRAPTNVPPNVDINIFQSADNDFELCMPSVRNFSLSLSGSFAVRAVKHGTSGNDMPNLNNSADSIKAVSLAAGSGSTSEPQITQFGESYKSLREMMKRYQFVASYRIDEEILALTDGSIKTAILAGQRPYIKIISGTALYNTQYMRRLVEMYRTVRGSLRLKVRPRQPTYYAAGTCSGYATYLPTPLSFPTYDEAQYLADFYLNTDSGTSSIPRARYSSTQTAEFEVPFLSHTGVQLLQKGFDTVSDFNKTNYWNPAIVLCTYVTSSTGTGPDPGLSVYLDIDCAFGDHTRFGTFIGIPTFTPLTVGAAGSPYPDRWIPPTPPVEVEMEEYVIEDVRPRKISTTPQFKTTQPIIRYHK